MQLDTQRTADFTEAHTFVNDTATAGASAVHSSEMRAAEAELATIEGKISVTGLLDIRKFFDSVDIPKLCTEALSAAFLRRELSISLVLHSAPKILRQGKAARYWLDASALLT